MTTTDPGPAPAAAAMITPARRRLLLVVGPLLAVTVVFACLILAQDQLPGNRDYSFTTEAPRAAHLMVEARSGIELEFRAGRTDRLQVFAAGGYSGDPPTVMVAADGSRIDAECPTAEPYSCGIQLEVEVPAGTAVTAHNRGGRIEADGLSGALDLTARNGDLQLTGVAGPIKADATNGRVLIEDSTAPRVTASTRNGSIELGLTEPESIDASTVNGEIVIDLGPCVPYAVDIDTSAASTVSVPVDEDAPRTIRARTRDAVIVECG